MLPDQLTHFALAYAKHRTALRANAMTSKKKDLWSVILTPTVFWVLRRL
jgi:hypothetical protein